MFSNYDAWLHHPVPSAAVSWSVWVLTPLWIRPKVKSPLSAFTESISLHFYTNLNTAVDIVVGTSCSSLYWKQGLFVTPGTVLVSNNSEKEKFVLSSCSWGLMIYWLISVSSIFPKHLNVLLAWHLVLWAYFSILAEKLFLTFTLQRLIIILAPIQITPRMNTSHYLLQWPGSWTSVLRRSNLRLPRKRSESGWGPLPWAASHQWQRGKKWKW